MVGESRMDHKKLSRAVLELKFMKKSKEKREIQDDAEERQELYRDQLSRLHEGADRIVMLSSYYDCMKFLPCRMSFGGMDPDIEKLNEDKLTGIYKVTKTEPLPPSGSAITGMDADVDEEEMLGSCLAENIRKKFSFKRKSSEAGFDDDNEHSNVESSDRKKFKSNARPLFKAGDPKQGSRGGGNFRGRGDYRGRGDFRGRGNFRGSGGGRGSRGDWRGRGRGDRRGRGSSDFRGRGNFSGDRNFNGRDSQQHEQYDGFNNDGKIKNDKSSVMEKKFLKPDPDY